MASRTVTDALRLFVATPAPQAEREICYTGVCGSNAQCREHNGIAVCSCLPDFFGNPYTGCRPECVSHAECARNKACENNKCIDPCEGICAPSALCRVHDHVAMCYCPDGYQGDPFTACTPQPITREHDTRPSGPIGALLPTIFLVYYLSNVFLSCSFSQRLHYFSSVHLGIVVEISLHDALIFSHRAVWYALACPLLHSHCARGVFSSSDGSSGSRARPVRSLAVRSQHPVQQQQRGGRVRLPARLPGQPDCRLSSRVHLQRRLCQRQGVCAAEVHRPVSGSVRTQRRVQDHEPQPSLSLHPGLHWQPQPRMPTYPT